MLCQSSTSKCPRTQESIRTRESIESDTRARRPTLNLTEKGRRAPNHLTYFVSISLVFTGFDNPLDGLHLCTFLLNKYDQCIRVRTRLYPPPAFYSSSPHRSLFHPLRNSQRRRQARTLNSHTIDDTLHPSLSPSSGRRGTALQNKIAGCLIVGTLDLGSDSCVVGDELSVLQGRKVTPDGGVEGLGARRVYGEVVWV